MWQASHRDATLERLRRENVAAKSWAQNERSLRAADHAAFAIERAGLTAQVAHRSTRQAETGTAAAHLVDTLLASVPPDCRPALDAIAHALAIHRAADDSLNIAWANLTHADSLELGRRAVRLDKMNDQLDAALARTDAAITAGRSRHGCGLGFGAGYGLIFSGRVVAGPTLTAGIVCR